MPFYHSFRNISHLLIIQPLALCQGSTHWQTWPASAWYYCGWAARPRGITYLYHHGQYCYNHMQAAGRTTTWCALTQMSNEDFDDAVSEITLNFPFVHCLILVFHKTNHDRQLMYTCCLVCTFSALMFQSQLLRYLVITQTVWVGCLPSIYMHENMRP